MFIKRILMLVFTLLTCGAAAGFAAGKADLQVKVAKRGATVNVDQIFKDGKVLVDVVDARGKPLFGLSAKDFSVTQSGRKANITSVKPIAESLDVPRHIVLVLDNSYSMEERSAIKPLLAGVGELLKIVRPIDDVQIVVFDSKQKIQAGGRELRVRTFRSNQPAELLAFAEKAYDKGEITTKTVLYEGMLAGLDLISKTPDTEPRFMVVFTDGEDLNSAYKREDVLKAAQSLENFNAYAIDFMMSPATDKFLAKFSRENHGQIWKAQTEKNLVAIFQSVASKMEYFYVVSYQFPPTGTLSVAPATLTFAEIGTTDAAKTVRQGEGLVTSVDLSALTLRPLVDTTYGIERWKVAVSNSNGSVAELAGEGAPAQQLTVPLPAGDLQRLATGGDLAVKMELQDSKGQSLVLTAAPVKIKVTRTRASLAVSPATLTFNEIRTDAAKADTRIDVSTLTLRPVIVSDIGITRWRVAVSNASGNVANLAGEGAPAAELLLPLPIADLQTLAAGGNLTVTMELENSTGQKLVVKAPPVKVIVVKTTATLTIVPTELTIEEVRTIDASPMLGHVYFAKGSSELADRYKRFTTQGETALFDEQKLRDTNEKYYQLLNIVGKRLIANPTATITLVGCNDNNGAEKGKKTLSGQRAAAVKNYLQTIWNIAPERMVIEARNLPAMPSSSRLKEGQAENRRVEIHSTEYLILAPIRSTYLSTRIDATALTLRPAVVAQQGIASWKITATNATGKLASLSGNGPPVKQTRILLAGGDLKALAAGGDITVQMELQDRKGQSMVLSPPPVKVNFIQTSQRLAKKEGLRVEEKYALILFDFNKEAISGANQEIINRIVGRIKTLPEATVEIVGHTDNIGTETYNIKLSERRAVAVNKLLAAAYGEGATDRIRHSGVGPIDPPYDNLLPETRAFNRTVTITLEYMSAE